MFVGVFSDCLAVARRLLTYFKRSAWCFSHRVRRSMAGWRQSRHKPMALALVRLSLLLLRSPSFLASG